MQSGAFATPAPRISSGLLAGFYRELDPTNTFNPGIGHTSKKKHWGGCC
ncbi:hypothetical protein [Staphylococcus gallinarum]